MKFNKGVTAAETVKNALRCKAAGIAISVTAINGMAGLNGDWQAHAIDTAKAVSAMKPEFIAFLTLRVYSGTPLHDWIEAGEFQMMGPADLMRETRLFLEHIDSEGSVFRSNHASNYLPLGGTLNRDREALIQTIDAALDGKMRLRRAVELGLYTSLHCCMKTQGLSCRLCVFLLWNFLRLRLSDIAEHHARTGAEAAVIFLRRAE